MLMFRISENFVYEKNIEYTVNMQFVFVPFANPLKTAARATAGHVTKTRPCNIQRFFTAVKMTIFSCFYFYYFHIVA